MRGMQLDDRIAAIEGLTANELARRIEQITPVAAWMFDRTRLGSSTGPAGPSPTRAALAAALADDTTMLLTLQLLDTSSLQLVVTLAAHGATMERSALDHELAALPAGTRDRLIQRLADRFVIHEPVTDAAITLRPGIARLVGLPGHSFDQLPFDTSITSDDLASWVKALGIRPVPNTKGARLDAVRSAICNAEQLAAHVGLLDPTAQHLFRRLVAAGGHGLATDPLDINAWMLRLHARYGQRLAPHADQATRAAQDLLDRGIAWFDLEQHQIGLWRDVLQAASGHLFTRWPVELDAELQPVAEPVEPGAHTLSTVESIVHHVTDQPLPGLKNGGVGVRAIRDLAKRLGRSAEEINCLVGVGMGLGIIVRTFETTGRGRNATAVYRYEIDQHRLEHWHAGPATTRWIELVAAWIDGIDTDYDQRTAVTTVRRAVVADLIQLPDGTGVTHDEFGTWVRSRHELAGYIDCDQLATELTAIGLCPDPTACGLTAAARTLLLRPNELHTITTHTSAQPATIVVQADFSVIAPPGLDPTVRARLDRLCTAGSTGSVAVLRLDRERIGAAIAASDDPDALIEFLTEHASNQLPPSTAQLVRDAERHQGGLTVASATTIVTADDVLGLAAAVKVKAAKLTLIAPTVATSPLPEAKVIAALRAKGLAPRTSTPATPTLARSSAARRVAHLIPAVPKVIHPDRTQLHELMFDW